jgi:N-methylhydantoinase A
LGFLNEHYFLGGTMSLRKDLAVKAIDEKIARPLGISVEAAAWGIHRIVNENMANAARVHIIEKGLDPRFFSMMAFGGAGPVHAFQVARLMGAPQLIVPGGAGVLSALGFLVTPVATEEIGSYVCRLDHLNWEKLNGMIETMQNAGFDFLKKADIPQDAARVSIVADMRYAGQGHEIGVSIPAGRLDARAIPEIERNFKTEYQLRYGRSIEGVPVEAVTWRVLVSGPTPELIPQQQVMGEHKTAGKGSRQVYWGTSYEETPVYDRYMIPAGEVVQGPCIIEEFESTTVVGKNAWATVDAFKNIVVSL